jgi:hypothetical protein
MGLMMGRGAGESSDLNIHTVKITITRSGRSTVPFHNTTEIHLEQCRSPRSSPDVHKRISPDGHATVMPDSCLFTVFHLFSKQHSGLKWLHSGWFWQCSALKTALCTGFFSHKERCYKNHPAIEQFLNICRPNREQQVFI